MLEITFEQLIYVQTLAYSGSLNQAAQTLSISKSGLSTAVSEFENEIGVKVFKRDYKGTRLTDAGQTILNDIAKVLHERNRLLNDANYLQNKDVPQRLRIQYVSSILNSVIINCFLENKTDNIQMDVSCHHTETIVNNVRAGKIDVGLIDINEISYTKAISDLKFIPICKSKIMIFVGPDNSLYSKEKVTRESLTNQHFSMYNDSSNDEAFARLQSVCGPLDLALKTNDNQLMIDSVSKNGNVGLGRYVELKNNYWLNKTGFRLKNINHLIPDRFTYGAIINPNVNLSIAAIHILGQLENTIAVAIK